ncbi:Fc.00g078740.m01.CDS01 [Cosmosporella sp. VM-42]
MMMISSRVSAQRLGALFILVTTWSTISTGLDVNICATLNTGSTPKNISIYQTNGLCHDFCIDDYAFAITQDNACWCSNYAPSKDTQKSVSDCNTPCPAWPSEDCGGDGVFGYVELDNVLPSGTQGASTSATDDTTTKTSASSSETTADNEPTSVVQTVTAGGTIKTVTLAPTNTGTTANDNSGITVKNKGLKTGEVVGIVVGVIGAVIIAAGLALFFWFRRKKQRSEQDYQDDPSIRDSSSGMAASGRPEMVMAGGSPLSQSAAINRNSSLLPADPRMNPFKEGLYMRSASHESINTLRDDHDYSRRIQPPVLRATNPDPENA